MATDKLKQIIEAAIPLTPDCDIKRSAEIKRRAKLRIDIEELLRHRDQQEPFKPEIQYKDTGREPSIKYPPEYNL